MDMFTLVAFSSPQRFHRPVRSYAGLIVASALMSWKTLILLTGSDSPVVVVLSGSMEPAFYRGDILFLNMGTAPLRTGEIVVYNAEEESSIPVVHRIIEVHERQDSKYVDILTKVCRRLHTTMVPKHP